MKEMENQKSMVIAERDEADMIVNKSTGEEMRPAASVQGLMNQNKPLALEADRYEDEKSAQKSIHTLSNGNSNLSGHVMQNKDLKLDDN